MNMYNYEHLYISSLFDDIKRNVKINLGEIKNIPIILNEETIGLVKSNGVLYNNLLGDWLVECILFRNVFDIPRTIGVESFELKQDKNGIYYNIVAIIVEDKRIKQDNEM